MSEIGIKGSCGPNDNGYINVNIRDAAKSLRGASELWSEGHYPHSNAKVMPDDHPIAKALAALAEVDKATAWFANTTHDPELFKPHVPSEQAQHRWDHLYQPRGSDMKLDGKFQGYIYKVKDGSVVPDDEYVVFLAKDNVFAAILPLYLEECFRQGADIDQIAAVKRMIERLNKWRDDNPERCKVPDAKGERMLDLPESDGTK
jgi:hypothetical protein